MDFSLSNEQRSWQMTARKFADEEIKPITLDLDEAPDAARHLRLGHHREGLASSASAPWPCPRNTAAKAPTTSPRRW